MKMLRIIAALVAVCLPAMAAEQSSFVLPTSPVAGANDLGSLTANYYNPAMRALAGSHNGPTAPANGPGGAPLLGQPWFDTSASPSINLRYWDGASWATLATLDASTHAWIIASASTIRSVTGTSDTLLDGDRGKLVDVANAGSVALTLPQAGTGGVFSAGWYATVRNSGAGTVTITPTTSLIDGASSLALRTGQALTIRSDGTNYKTTLLHQPANANLWGLSSLSTAADKCVYWTGAGLPALIDCKSWFRSVMAAADVASGRAALGLTIGSDIQAFNANLAAWAGLTGAAGKVGYFTGPGAMAMFDSTSFGRSLSNAADAAALRTLAGLANVVNLDTSTQANVSFTGLSAAAAAADADTFPVNQGAGNLKQTFAAIKTWIKAWIVKGDVGLGNVANVDTTNAANISSGTLPAARMPSPSASTLGGLQSLTCSSSNWFRTLSTSGALGCAQPAFSDLSGQLSASTQISGSVPIANGGSNASTIPAARVNFNIESVTTLTNANLAATISDRVIATTATNLTAARTVTLPSLSTYNPGQQTVVVDSGGAINGVNTLTITANGSDTINGASSLVISSQYGGAVLWPIGANKWGYIASAGGGGGGVSQVTCGTGLDGGTITSSGTCSLSAARRTLPTVQSFTSGSGTYTTPANVLRLEIKMVGGGSGGGAGGVGTLSTAGGNTTFGSRTAGGAAGSSNLAAGTPGSASGGLINIPGSYGGVGSTNILNVILTGAGGQGGSSCLGGSGGGSDAASGTAAATNSGSGGGGSSSAGNATNRSGHGGSSGGCVYDIINGPASTYSYAVGTAGAGASNGTYSGGTGAAGRIDVIEHYNFLLKRDLDPHANDNTPMWLNVAA